MEGLGLPLRLIPTLSFTCGSRTSLRDLGPDEETLVACTRTPASARKRPATAEPKSKGGRRDEDDLRPKLHVLLSALVCSRQRVSRAWGSGGRVGCG